VYRVHAHHYIHHCNTLHTRFDKVQNPILIGRFFPGTSSYAVGMCDLNITTTPDVPEGLESSAVELSSTKDFAFIPFDPAARSARNVLFSLVARMVWKI
jgi:hypothetical protein